MQPQSNLVQLQGQEQRQKKQVHIAIWIHRALKQMALDRDITLEAAMNEAMESYLASQGIEQPESKAS